MGNQVPWKVQTVQTTAGNVAGIGSAAMVDTDMAQWSDDRLVRRLQEVTKSSKVHHTDAREAEIRRELAHLLFELRSRGIEEIHSAAADSK